MSFSEKAEKSVRTSVWLLYILIVFEILYMISPFAFYYYSYYAIPLNWFQQSPVPSWLTIYIFPHFTDTGSLLVKGVLMLAWPFIGIGISIFGIGFFQIYWAKFTRRQVVSRGLYRVIRHPQYVGLAILGLGTTIYWSRIIVYIAYFSMLFLYYMLAKQEEQICLKKYGQSYQDYLDSTGMFLPNAIEDRIPSFPTFLPSTGVKKILARIVLFVVYISIVIAIGLSLKSYNVSTITRITEDQRVVIAVSHMDQQLAEKIVNAVYGDEETTGILEKLAIKRQLVYIIPSNWEIPELDVWGNGEINMMINVATHGNPPVYNGDNFSILVTEPVTYDQDATGEDILMTGIAFIPRLSVEYNLKSGLVTNIELKSNRGKWDGIPVPIY